MIILLDSVVKPKENVVVINALYQPLPKGTTPAASLLIPPWGVKIEPIVPAVKLRSKKILCTADVPSSSAIWKRIDVYPAALTNAENVNV